MYAYTGCVWLYISVIYIVEAFRPRNYGKSCCGFPLFNDFVDNMLFECAIYKDQIKVKPNIDLTIGRRKSSRSNQPSTDEVVDSIKEELDKVKATKNLNINRIKFPIVGRVGRPETKYLRDIYYILEENNRGLKENSLGDDKFEEIPKEDQRIMIHPRQITKVFTSPETHKAVDMFPTLLNSKSPAIPGQVSTISLQEEHKKLLVNELKNSNIFGIFVTFVTSYDEEERNSPEISPNCMLCEFVDITNIDTTGKIVVRGIERFKINKILAVSEAIVKGEVALLRDFNGPLKNQSVSEETARVIEKLYDKCNFLEAEFRRLAGNMEDVKVIEAREPFSVKMSNLIEDINLDDESQKRILELTGFAALEFHADLDTKLHAVSSVDTEERLILAKYVLEKKCDLLRSRISEFGAKDTQEDSQES